LALSATLILPFVAKPVMAAQAVSEPAACAAIYTSADCTYGWVSQRKAGYRNGPRYVSNYGWAEVQALRAFERRR
jgi:hypothetical protein